VKHPVDGTNPPTHMSETETPTKTFSYKQELIQLHQMLAETRMHCKEKFGLDTDIEDLPKYENIGITSLDLNADITDQLDAVLALANELATTVENAEKPSVEEAGQETSVETVKTTLFDVTEDGVNPSGEQTEIVSAEQGTDTEPEASDKEEVYQDGDAELVDTSILASWGEIQTEEAMQAEQAEEIDYEEWDYETNGLEQGNEKAMGTQKTVNAY
jgi:hypothetical protein